MTRQYENENEKRSGGREGGLTERREQQDTPGHAHHSALGPENPGTPPHDEVAQDNLPNKNRIRMQEVRRHP